MPWFWAGWAGFAHWFVVNKNSFSHWLGGMPSISISYSPWKANRNWGWSTSLKRAIAHHCSKHVVLFAASWFTMSKPYLPESQTPGFPLEGVSGLPDPWTHQPWSVSCFEATDAFGTRQSGHPSAMWIWTQKTGASSVSPGPKQSPSRGTGPDGKDGTSQPWNGLWKLKQSWVLGCKWKDYCNTPISQQCLVK